MINVTVIVPNYNHEQFLKLRIDSILNQTYTNFEVIILDDHSSDSSREIIEQYRGHEKISNIIYNDSNTGSPFKQWLRGIKMAKSEYIWIAESDDYADPEFLATMVNLVYHHPDVALAYCNSDKVDTTGAVMEDLHCYMDGEYKSGLREVKERLCFYNTITNVSSCLIKAEYALDAIIGLGEYRTCGDWIFYARILQHGNLAYTSRKLNHYRWHPGSISYSASQTSSYVAEGINVIKYIDYKIVKFSLKEYMALCKAWMNKAIHASRSCIFSSLVVLFSATCKFCTAKFILSFKG